MQYSLQCQEWVDFRQSKQDLQAPPTPRDPEKGKGSHGGIKRSTRVWDGVAERKGEHEHIVKLLACYRQYILSVIMSSYDVVSICL